MHCSVPRALKKKYSELWNKDQKPQVLVPTYLTSCIWRKGLAVGNAWKHTLSLRFQIYLHRNVKLKWVLLSTSYAILLFSALDFERHMMAKAHNFYFKLSQNAVTPECSWTPSCSSACSHKRMQHWHTPSALRIRLEETIPFFVCFWRYQRYCITHVSLLCCFFEISFSTAYQNWHSIAGKKWAVTIEVAGPTPI